MNRKCGNGTLLWQDADLRTLSLLARTSFLALWILIGLVRNRSRRFLLSLGYGGLITVIQTRHKEPMRIKKRIHGEETISGGSPKKHKKCALHTRAALRLSC